MTFSFQLLFLLHLKPFLQYFVQLFFNTYSSCLSLQQNFILKHNRHHPLPLPFQQYCHTIPVKHSCSSRPGKRSIWHINTISLPRSFQIHRPIRPPTSFLSTENTYTISSNHRPFHLKGPIVPPSLCVSILLFCRIKFTPQKGEILHLIS